MTVSVEQLISSEEFKSHLLNLNGICASAGPHYGVAEEGKFRIEGGLLYQHVQLYSVADGPEASRIQKIRNFVLACSRAQTMLEIGSNAGHSVLLALLANREIVIYANDIFHHHYTAACMAYLKQQFGSRLHVLPGDSREVLPLLATHKKLQFDVFHVDGGHGQSLCRTDIANCLRLSHEHSMMIIDDTSAIHIKEVYAEFAAMGYLVEERLGGLFIPDDQILAKMFP